MREYRGLTKDGKQWVYGWYVFIDGRHCIMDKKAWSSTYGLDAAISFDNFNEVLPETVGQQVGLKDKNGVEIYEGDIIVWSEKQVGIWPGQEKPQEVKYPFICGNTHLGKVIGNIHDKPKGE